MGHSSGEIDKQAAFWAARMSSGDVSPDDKEAFASWLAADIRHYGAYVRVEVCLEHLGRLGAAAPSQTRLQKPSWVPSWNRRTLIAGGAGAGVLAAAGLVGVTLGIGNARQKFTTKIGEYRTLVLEDGSIATLNTDSSLVVEFSDAVRHLRLEKGEALFKVAKNKRRPFVVQVSDTEVRAVGTSFSVRLLPDRPVQILVREGVVEVKRRDMPNVRAVRATAETETVVPSHASISVRNLPHPQLARDLAWQFGRISFEEETLASASLEFARYSTTKIVVDPSVANRTITGLFDSNDPVGFAKIAASILNLHVEEGPSEVRIIR